MLLGLTFFLTPKPNSDSNSESPISISKMSYSNGLIAFCPCQGRTGNQLETLLGMLALARRTGRKLVLPGFVDYQGTETPTVRAANEVLDASLLSGTAILSGNALIGRNPAEMTLLCPKEIPNCLLRQGQPSTAYWDTVLGTNITPSEEEVFDMSLVSSGTKEEWSHRFPPSKYPVLVLAFAPVPCPATAADHIEQKHLAFAAPWRSRAEVFIRENLEEPWIAVHARHGPDWQTACQMGVGSRNWMASGQCLAGNETMSIELCYPSAENVARQVAEAARRHSGRAVFLATDDSDLIEPVRIHLAALRRPTAIHLVTSPARSSAGTVDPWFDLAVLSSPRAVFFLGTCPSTFSAFAARQRGVLGLENGFFGKVFG